MDLNTTGGDSVGQYPPPLNERQLQDLVTEIKDWQISNGSSLKLVHHEQEATVPAIPVGAAAFPTLFPEKCMTDAVLLGSIINRLYATIAEDHEWLQTVLQDLIDSDEMINALWSIHCTVRTEGRTQDLTLGIFRADYMLHVSDPRDSWESASLKQVEVNTISVAGGIHGNIVSNMHQHLWRKVYNDMIHKHNPKIVSSGFISHNETLTTIVEAIQQADQAYVKSRSAPYSMRRKTCVLFVVQGLNINICDERPIEYALWDKWIPTFRVTFGDDILARTKLTEDRKLLYCPPDAEQDDELFEVSVVYLRAGYDPAEYNAAGRECRLRMERSRAIKCPSVACHLATLKRVQQALTLPGALERFLPEHEARELRSTFMLMYRLDQPMIGPDARKLVTEPETAMKYVLKPSLEGGGHNIFRYDISQFLANTPEAEWHKYTIMELINSPTLHNILVSSAGIYQGPVVSELGIFGTCLWRKSDRPIETGNSRPIAGCTGSVHVEIIEESKFDYAWSFKTKASDIDEMSVVKGYGCFDSPMLIDTDFKRHPV